MKKQVRTRPEYGFEKYNPEWPFRENIDVISYTFQTPIPEMR